MGEKKNILSRRIRMKSQKLSAFKLGLLAIITAVVSYAPAVQACTSQGKQTFTVEELSAKKDKGAKKNKANKKGAKQEKIQQFNAKKGGGKGKKLNKAPKIDKKKRHPHEGGAPQ
jgi:hypothetical protein